MTWRAEWTDRARKDLGRLASGDGERILDALDCILEDPATKLDRLVNSCLYKCRVGNYRIVVNVIFERRVVLVTRVKKRSRAYG